MAFGLSKFKAYALPNKAPTKSGGQIKVEMAITGTSSDVDLDIGDDSGTFWGAVVVNSTIGAEALATLQEISTAYGDCSDVYGKQLRDRVQIGTVASAGQYSLAYQNNRPNIAFNAADGETEINLILIYEVGDGKLPVSYPDLG